MSTPNHVYDVIIVGAGISGLAAAQTLVGSNKECLVLEARSRPGGRVWTDYNTFPVPVDVGAHWIHTFWFNPLVKLTLKHGVELYPNEYQRAGFYKGGKRVERKIVKQARVRFNYVLTALEEGNWSDDVSMEEATREVLQKLSPPNEDQTIQQVVMGFIFHLVSDNCGLDLHDVKLNNWKKGEEDFDVDGGDQLPTTGMWSVFQKEFKDILPSVKYNCVVTSIDYSDHSFGGSGGGVRIDSNMGSFYARHALVTVPLTLIKQNKITFSPPFPPDFQEAFKWFRTGILNCITVQFEHTFWNEDDEFMLFLPDDGTPYPPTATTHDYPFNMLFNTYHHLLPGLLGAWTFGKQAASWEGLSDGQQLERVLGTLRRMFVRPLPAVVRFVVSRWHSDPFALGSYSSTELHFEPHVEVLKRPLMRGKMLLAGEALAEKYGTVHGAYLNGVEQAKKLCQIINNSTTTTVKAKL